MLRAKCTQCGKTVRGGDDWAGRTGNCPNCHGQIAFPGVALPDDIPQTTSSDIELVSKSKYAPIIESWVQDFACFLIGCVGYAVLHQTIGGLWWGKPADIFFSGPLRAEHPIWYWLKNILMTMFGGFMLWIGVAGVKGLYKDFVALVPRRFSLRALLITMTIAAVVAWLVALSFSTAAASTADPSIVRRIMLLRLAALLFFGPVGLFLLGATWIEHMKGRFYVQSSWYVDRADTPRFFFAVAALRYAIAFALLITAAWLFLFGIQK